MAEPKPIDSPDNPTPGGRLFTGHEIAEFLLRACHDLKAPIRAIRAHAELLGKSKDLPGAASGDDPRLAFIIEGAGKLDQLVDDLSSYSLALRIDPGSFGITRVGVLLRTVLAKLDKEFHQKLGEVTYGKLPSVPGDPDRLMQVFENLLCHRIGTARHITADRHAEGWLFRVRDSGPSIEAADLERIFQPFVHGLGLAACREIVERHGGRLWAESQAGSGCTFLFTLPAAPV